MHGACIVNEVVQTMIADLCAQLKDLDADGVVLDITDAFPNSTSERYRHRRLQSPIDTDSPTVDVARAGAPTGRSSLQNSCFCKRCVAALRREHWTEGASPFKSPDTNLSRFVLRPSETGAEPNDIEDDWLDKLDGAELGEFAKARGFVEASQDGSGKDAEQLLRYLNARSAVTASAVSRLGQAASKVGLRTAVVLGPGLYDMSQNVNLSTLANVGGVDEFWAHSFEPHHLRTDGPVMLRFLFARSSYYLNALFDNLEDVSGSGSGPSSALFEQLARNALSLDSRQEFTKGQCAQVGRYAGIHGFVGAPLFRADLIDLVNQKTKDGSLPDAIRVALLSRFNAT